MQSLVDDSLVMQEKIGVSNYFWAFPSTALKTRKRKLEDLEGELGRQEALSRKLAKQMEEEQQSRAAAGDSDGAEDREAQLKRLGHLREEAARLDAELTLFKENDPVVVEAKRKAAAEALEAANRWTGKPRAFARFV